MTRLRLLALLISTATAAVFALATVSAHLGRGKLRVAQTTPCGRAAVWVFMTFSVFFIGVTRGHFVGTDEIAVYEATRSLWEEGNLSTPPINNTFPGRDGRYYGVYSAGQSVAALPLYGFGKALGIALDYAGRGDWIQTFAGPSVALGYSRWGGDIEIFFVNLLNCFTTACLCAVFFAFSLRLGVSPRWALASTALLGLTSYVGPFSAGFLQHSAEALFLLWSFYFLFSDAQRPAARPRAGAGTTVALMLLYRFPSVVALPGLGLYLLWSVSRRCAPGFGLGTMAAGARQILPFVIAVAAALALHTWVNYVKFGVVSLTGGYAERGFSTPLRTGLYGLLLSPGDSIFLFAPLLLLTPWTVPKFRRCHPAETYLILFLTASYLVFYGTFESWHGLWSALGPRYLVPVVPLLLLTLGSWAEHIGRRSWLVIAPLAAAGFWVQLVHVAVNFAYVYHHENYPNFDPPLGFLFRADASPLVAHTNALFAADYRVDMWLVNVYRSFGLGRVMLLSVVIGGLLITCAWRLWRILGEPAAPPAPVVEIRYGARPSTIIALLALVSSGTALALAVDCGDRVLNEGRGTLVAPGGQGTDAIMQSGLDALYGRNDPKRAVEFFRKVLERNLGHYGATFQLALALERAGERTEARVLWEKMLEMAERANDKQTVETARHRLEKADVTGDEVWMKAGLDAL